MSKDPDLHTVHCERVATSALLTSYHNAVFRISVSGSPGDERTSAFPSQRSSRQHLIPGAWIVRLA